jgi:hypothetical protein
MSVKLSKLVGFNFLSPIPHLDSIKYLPILIKHNYWLFTNDKITIAFFAVDFNPSKIYVEIKVVKFW